MKFKKELLAATIVFCILATAPLVLAQSGEGELPVADFLKALGLAIPSSFIVAFTTSFLGYLRDTDPNTNFDVVKFIATLIISLLIGTVTMATGWDYTSVVTWLGNAGLTVWIYWLAKVVALKVGWVKAT